MGESMVGAAVDAVGHTTGLDMVCTLTRIHLMQVTHMQRMLGPGPNLFTVANERQMAKSPTNLKEARLLKPMRQQLNMISRKHHQHIQTKTG